MGLLLPQKGEGGMVTGPESPMGHEGLCGERLPLLPGANTALTITALGLATTGHLALQPWQSGDGPFCGSVHQFPLAAAWFACTLQRLQKKMSGTERESVQTRADTALLGLAGQPSGSSPSGFKASERIGLAKGLSAACISLEKPCLLPPSFGAKAFERGRAELQEFYSGLGRRGKAGNDLFLFIFFFFP